MFRRRSIDWIKIGSKAGAFKKKEERNMKKDNILLIFGLIVLVAFYIFEKLFQLPYGDILALTGFILFLFVTSLALCSSVHGLRSFKSWIYAIMSSILPLGVIYLIDTSFPDIFLSTHDDWWGYFLVGFYLFAGFWYLRMDKKAELLISKSSWIAYYLVGLMLVAISVGLYFQENKSFLYIVFSITVLTTLILVYSIRCYRSQKVSLKSTETKDGEISDFV
jgi:hypothetical protein